MKSPIMAFALTREIGAGIDDWFCAHRSGSRSAAVRQILSRGLKDWRAEVAAQAEAEARNDG